MTMMLRDMELTPREEESIRLTKEDLHDIAAPFAGLASKNDFLRKHGREIVSAADSYEAILTLGIWMRRVNKIASKHKKADPAYATARAERKTSRQPHTHRPNPSRENGSAMGYVAAQSDGRTGNPGGLGPRNTNGREADYVAPPSNEEIRLAAAAHPLVTFPTQVIEQEAQRNGRTGENPTEGIAKPPLPPAEAVINFGTG